ncbi:MAG: T9SS type A sorting domain-containing protein [Candidatus Kapabacteria bacterium]|nr:T9SS type A sorting domain-containing protein [Candidatus Kapabacteria bacterium]
MNKFLLLTMAVLIFLLCAGANAQPTIDPEVIWESTTPVTFNDLKFSTDDKYFYIRNEDVGSQDVGIHKFNSENGEYMGMFIPGLINDFGIIQEYGWMFCTRAEGLSIYDMNTGAFIRNIGESWPGGWFDVSPDKSKIVFRQQGSMWVYSLPNLEEICRYQHNGSPRFINNSQIAMTRSDVNLGGDNWAIDVYSIEEQKIIKTLPIPHPATVGDKIYVSPDYKNLITTNSLSVNFYDIETGELKKKMTSGQAFNVDFNPTGKFYVLCVYNQTTFYNYGNYEAIMQINFDEYGSAKFLNNKNKQILVFNKLRKLKMLHFDFDSLATGVITKEDIPIIYPNPTSDYVNIPIESIYISKVTITDYFGRNFPAVYLMETGKKSDSIRLNLTGLPKGTYFISIQNKNSQKTYKLIKGE